MPSAEFRHRAVAARVPGRDNAESAGTGGASRALAGSSGAAAVLGKLDATGPVSPAAYAPRHPLGGL